MSHMQDIQKLRLARNVPPFYSTTQRFIQPSQPEIYNINFDRFVESNQQNPMKFYDTYTKYITSK